MDFSVNFHTVIGFSIESKINVVLSFEKTRHSHEVEIEVDNQIV
tara:strand:- start:141 stop:272 length:132 start_codon:yes stop_codon:yes gene_type:complete